MYLLYGTQESHSHYPAYPAIIQPIKIQPVMESSPVAKEQKRRPSPNPLSTTGQSIPMKRESADERMLREMGYKQELRRGFNGIMSFAFCFTSVGVLSAISLSYGYGLSTGGPAVTIWGWLATSIMTIITGCCMAEICSTYPSAGSVYHWAGQLSSVEWAPFVSYVCGWFNFLGR